MTARGRFLWRAAAHTLPWSAASLALIVPSGLAMFVAHANDLMGNPVFALKICLILLAGANAGIFHAGVFRGAAQWDVAVMPPLAARVAAAVSLLLWLSAFWRFHDTGSGLVPLLAIVLLAAAARAAATSRR